MKTAIVGCGAIAPVHAEAISQTDAVLCAVCDIKREKAEAMSEKYGGRVYTDFEVLLETEKPDTVHICTPHYLHLPMAKRALSLGINVVLEKPPAMNDDELLELENAVKSSTASLVVCFQNRYNLTTDTALEMISDGRYGKLKGGRGTVTWKRGGAYYTDSDWRGKRKTEGGGVLINQSIHTLDLLNFFLGTPISVSALVSNMTHGDEIDVEDTVCADIDYGETRATFFATTSCVSSPSAEVTLFFERARVTLDDRRLTVIGKNGESETFDGASGTLHGKTCWGSSHERIIKQFYDSLAGGQNPCPLDSCKNTVRLMSAIYKTAVSKPERETL